jgi:hypothetical protein
MWKHFVERGRPQMTIWRMRIACWIPKVTSTHTQVVQYLLFFHTNNGCTNAPQYYVIRTLPILLFGYRPREVFSFVEDNRQSFVTWHVKLESQCLTNIFSDSTEMLQRVNSNLS